MFIATNRSQTHSSFTGEMFTLLISLLRRSSDSIAELVAINISALTGLKATPFEGD